MEALVRIPSVIIEIIGYGDLRIQATRENNFQKIYFLEREFLAAERLVLKKKRSESDASRESIGFGPYAYL
jgi:hypothetical protein